MQRRVYTTPEHILEGDKVLTRLIKELEAQPQQYL